MGRLGRNGDDRSEGHDWRRVGDGWFVAEEPLKQVGELGAGERWGGGLHSEIGHEGKRSATKRARNHFAHLFSPVRPSN
ncbi:hypothetical protein GCM10028801_45570 [Nocardioides maradonensis]